MGFKKQTLVWYSGVCVSGSVLPMMPLSLLSSVELGVVVVVVVLAGVMHGPGWQKDGLSAEPELRGKLEQGLSALGDAVLLVRVEHGLAP